MRRTDEGFTLIEMLVVIALLAIIMIGLLNLLDTSSKISVVETELADTQENVRFAAYHILRTARMMGSSVMPFAANVGGTDYWQAGELRSNQTGTSGTPYETVDVTDGSDVLTLRGFFEIQPFFTDPRNDFGPTSVNIRESSGGEVINDAISLIDLDADGQSEGLQGRGLMFMGKMDQREYAVGEIADNGTLSGTSPNRVLTINFIQGDPRWQNLNRDGFSWPPVFDVYKVAILESYTYYVSPDFTLMRMRAGGLTGVRVTEPVAVNIGNLQVELGLDTTGDGLADSWLNAPTATGIVNNRVLGLRVTVFGRTIREVPDWVEPATTFQNPDSTVVADIDIDDIDRFAKWRRIQVEAALRNYLF